MTDVQTVDQLRAELEKLINETAAANKIATDLIEQSTEAKKQATDLLAQAETAAATAADLHAKAEESLANAESTRISNTIAQAGVATADDTAAADLRAKQLANEKAESDQRVLELKEMIALAKGTVPDLSTVQKNTVTFSDGKAMREAEITRAALVSASKAAASQILGNMTPAEIFRREAIAALRSHQDGESFPPELEASESAWLARAAELDASVRSLRQIAQRCRVEAGRLEAAEQEAAAMKKAREAASAEGLAADRELAAIAARGAAEAVGNTPNPYPTRTLLVTATSTLLGDFVTRQNVHVEGVTLQTALANLIAAITTAVTPTSTTGLRSARTGAPTILPLAAPAVTAATVAASVVSAGITQLAKLAEVDVDVRGASSEVAAISVHATLIEAIRTECHESHSSHLVHLLHESVASPHAESPITRVLEDLVGSVTALTTQVALLDAKRTKAATAIAATETALKAKLPPEEKKKLLTQLQEQTAKRDVLDALSTKATALTKQHTDFVTRITTPSEKTGRTALGVALMMEQVDDDTAILVVSGANAQTHQMMISRRLRMPRLQISATVAFDWFLLVRGRITASDRATGSIALHAEATRHGFDWQTLGAWT